MMKNKCKEMKKSRLLQLGLMVVLPLFMACNNDSDVEMDAMESVEFKVEFADFNAKQEIGVTRNGNQEVKIEEKVVDLGNNILALVSLQRDTTRTVSPAATRTIDDDTYTMLAYDHETHEFKGETVGKVEQAKFVVTGKRLRLGAGKYDFVLFNSKVKRQGDRLIVPREHALTAFIGRVTQEIDASSGRKYVALNLKRVGAKVQMRLETYVPFENITAELKPVDDESVHDNSVYDAATGQLQPGTCATFKSPLTFKYGERGYVNDYYSNSKEIVSLLDATDVSKLKLVFKSGKPFGTDIDGLEYQFKPSAGLKIEANGYYVLKVKMFYNFFYLMADGGIGRTGETVQCGGTRTPIAVVLSRSKRIAMALYYAQVEKYMWCDYKYMFTHHGNNYASTHTLVEEKGDRIYDGIWGHLVTKGIDETWDASYSTVKVKGNKVKAENADFYAIYGAAHYDPKVEYKGANPLKWFLPSASDFIYVFNLGRGDKSSENKYGKFDRFIEYNCNGALVSSACTQVGGDRMIGPTYWTSSALDPLFDIIYNDVKYAAISVSLEEDKFTWSYTCYQFSAVSRPFVSY